MPGRKEQQHLRIVIHWAIHHSDFQLHSYTCLVRKPVTGFHQQPELWHPAGIGNRHSFSVSKRTKIYGSHPGSLIPSVLCVCHQNHPPYTPQGAKRTSRQREASAAQYLAGFTILLFLSFPFRNCRNIYANAKLFQQHHSPINRWRKGKPHYHSHLLVWQQIK